MVRSNAEERKRMASGLAIRRCHRGGLTEALETAVVEVQGCGQAAAHACESRQRSWTVKSLGKRWVGWVTEQRFDCDRIDLFLGQ